MAGPMGDRAASGWLPISAPRPSRQRSKCLESRCLASVLQRSIAFRPQIQNLRPQVEVHKFELGRQAAFPVVRFQCDVALLRRGQVAEVESVGRRVFLDSPARPVRPLVLRLLFGVPPPPLRLAQLRTLHHLSELALSIHSHRLLEADSSLKFNIGTRFQLGTDRWLEWLNKMGEADHRFAYFFPGALTQASYGGWGGVEFYSNFFDAQLIEVKLLNNVLVFGI